MLHAYTQQQPPNIVELAYFAFSHQSLNVAKGKFLKREVQSANVAFEAFKATPNDLKVVTAFRDAAKLCESKCGFQALVTALENKITTLSATLPTPTSSSSAIKTPRV